MNHKSSHITFDHILKQVVLNVEVSLTTCGIAVVKEINHYYETQLTFIYTGEIRNERCTFPIYDLRYNIHLLNKYKSPCGYEIKFW